ncbi:MAG TPA: hypothetical protein VEP90_02830 [Methylomirabilota bacterium]|nr:hypothetical protein [Methylomirabilota bacterium]
MFPDMAGLATEGLGLGFQAVGAYEGYQAQQGISKANQNVARDQQLINQQNENQMKLNANRARMEAFRNNQRARSLALNSAAGQGAQFGSGLQGGYGQISGQSGTNILGINQNLKIGEAIATYNQDISNQQMALAKYQGQASTAAGVSSLGSGAFSLGQGIVSYGTPSKFNPGASGQ